MIRGIGSARDRRVGESTTFRLWYRRWSGDRRRRRSHRSHRSCHCRRARCFRIRFGLPRTPREIRCPWFRGEGWKMGNPPSLVDEDDARGGRGYGIWDDDDRGRQPLRQRIRGRSRSRSRSRSRFRFLFEKC